MPNLPSFRSVARQLLVVISCWVICIVYGLATKNLPAEFKTLVYTLVALLVLILPSLLVELRPKSAAFLDQYFGASSSMLCLVFSVPVCTFAIASGSFSQRPPLSAVSESLIVIGLLLGLMCFVYAAASRGMTLIGVALRKFEFPWWTPQLGCVVLILSVTWFPQPWVEPLLFIAVLILLVFSSVLLVVEATVRFGRFALKLLASRDKR